MNLVEKEDDSNEVEMAKRLLLRGHNDEFFFIERENSSQSENIMAAELQFTENSWSPQKRPIFKGCSGAILALEFDEDATRAIDSKWIEKEESRELVSVPVKNQLYVLDSYPAVI